VKEQDTLDVHLAAYRGAAEAETQSDPADELASPAGGVHEGDGSDRRDGAQ